MKVVLGSIAWRNYEANYVHSLAMLLKKYPQVGLLPQTGDALVERARSVVATFFLRHTQADVLLTIDSDIDFDPDHAMRICQQAEEYGIVVGAYAGRSFGHPKPTCELWPGTAVTFENDDTPVEIKYGASGFMAIHRRVFEALLKRSDMPLCHAGKDWEFYPFYHTEVVEDEDPAIGPILLSEDFAFCYKARQEGFNTYLNPAVRLGHQGTHVYHLEDMANKLLPVSPIRLSKEGVMYTVEIASVEEPELVASAPLKA